MRMFALLVLAGCAPVAPPAAPPPSPPTVAVAPPVVHEIARYPLAGASNAEHELFAAINTARGSAGLPQLAWSDEVAAIAHQASAELDFGELAVRDLSINLATADGVAAALDAWLHDDRQRDHLLSPTATQIGLAVRSTSDGRMAATAVVFRAPVPIDTAALASHVATVLIAGDRKVDADLRSIAQGAAADLAAHHSHADTLARMQSRLRDIEGRWSKIHNSMTRLVDVADLERDDQLAAKLLGGEAADDVGVGVAQGAHPEAGDGAIWVVVVYGRALPTEITRPFGGTILNPN